MSEGTLSHVAVHRYLDLDYFAYAKLRRIYKMLISRTRAVFNNAFRLR